MARKIKERKIKSPSIYNYRYICKPRNFSQQSLRDIQKQIDKVLADDGIAVCIFDADVARDKPSEMKKLQDMRKNHPSCQPSARWIHSK